MLTLDLSDEFVHPFLASEQAQIIKLAPNIKFSKEKKPNVKPVLLGHYLGALNNLQPNNVLNSLEYYFYLLTVRPSQPSKK